MQSRPAVGSLGAGLLPKLGLRGAWGSGGLGLRSGLEGRCTPAQEGWQGNVSISILLLSRHVVREHSTSSVVIGEGAQRQHDVAAPWAQPPCQRRVVLGVCACLPPAQSRALGSDCAVAAALCDWLASSRSHCTAPLIGDAPAPPRTLLGAEGPSSVTAQSPGHSAMAGGHGAS